MRRTGVAGLYQEVAMTTGDFCLPVKQQLMLDMILGLSTASMEEREDDMSVSQG